MLHTLIPNSRLLLLPSPPLDGKYSLSFSSGLALLRAQYLQNNYHFQTLNQFSMILPLAQLEDLERSSSEIAEDKNFPVALAVLAKLHPEYTKPLRWNVLLQQTFPVLMEAEFRCVCVCSRLLPISCRLLSGSETRKGCHSPCKLPFTPLCADSMATCHACDRANMRDLLLGYFPEIWEIHLPKRKQLRPQAHKSSLKKYLAHCSK